MFKRIIILSILLGLSFSVFAQEEASPIKQEEAGGDSKTMKASLVTDGSESNINGVNLLFCNNGEDNVSSDLTLPIKQGEKREICIVVFNKNSADEEILINFAPGVPIDIGGRSCGDNYKKDNGFFDFITPSREGKVLVPANGSIIKKALVQFPIGINGLKRGCVAYSIAPKQNKQTNFGGGNIKLSIRKISILNFFVSDLKDIKGNIDLQATNSFDNNKNLNLAISVKNSFPMDQTINVSGLVSNIFGYRQNFVIGESILNANGEVNLNANIGQIPRYKGLFKITLDIKYKPYFNFDITNSGIDPKILEGKSYIKTQSFFIFPTIPAIGLVLFILLIYLAFFKKPKVINQQTLKS